MPHLQQLRPDHATGVLAFELENRAYFATWIYDRGDEYFERFGQRHDALLAEQERGIAVFYVFVAEDGSIVGRFNLVFKEDGVVELGDRVAQHATGLGIATAGVREACGLVAVGSNVRVVRAAAASKNPASRKVLTNAGFLPVGPANPADLGGQPGTWYQRDSDVVGLLATEAGEGDNGE